MKPSKCAVLCLLVITASISPVVAQDNNLPVEEKLYGLSLVWQEANYNFVYFDRSPDLDWQSAYRHAIARVLQTRDNDGYVREVQRFVALLGEAHTKVTPPKSFRARHGGHPAIELEEIERRAVVVNTSKALARELPLGSAVVTVAGQPAEDYLRERVFPLVSASTEHYRWRQAIRGDRFRCAGLLVGDVGSTVEVEFELPDGSARTLALERVVIDDSIEWQHPRRARRDILEYRDLGDGILYFALNTFNTPDIVTEFEKHLDKLPDARAVVLDIRNNGGGNSSNGWKIGLRFAGAPLEPSHWRTREHRAAYKAWGKHSQDPVKQAHYAMNAWYEPDEFSTLDPYEETFVVPVAILSGSSTYSAAEDFLSFMRGASNVVFVGGPSAGSTGQPLSFEIPGGAWVAITAKRDVMADGTEFVGIGVHPDIEVYQTVAAWRAGRDLVLERAVAELKQTLNEQ